MTSEAVGATLCHPVAQGHHVYSEVRTPVTDKGLTVKKAENNDHNCHAVSIVMNAD